MKLYLVVSVPKTAALSFHYDTQRRDNRPIKLPSERCEDRNTYNSSASSRADSYDQPRIVIASTRTTIW